MKKEASGPRGKVSVLDIIRSGSIPSSLTNLCDHGKVTKFLWIFVFSLASYFLDSLWTWSEIMCVKGQDKPIRHHIQRHYNPLSKMKWHTTQCCVYFWVPLFFAVRLFAVSVLKMLPSLEGLSPSPTSLARAKGWEVLNTLFSITNKSLRRSLRIWLWLKRFVSVIWGI